MSVITKYQAVTPATLDDLKRFSQAHGKFRYCSCMRWRLRSSEFGRDGKAGRIRNLEQLAASGEPTGILAYSGDEPVGWCAIAPRERLRGLERYRKLTHIDDAAVWSVTCFFIDAKFRRKGLMLGLLSAAVDYARSSGANIIEGYPVERTATSYTYMGAPSTFAKAGFKNVTPPGRERLIYRYEAPEGSESGKV